MPRGSAPIIPRGGSAFRICLRQIHGSRRRAGARVRGGFLCKSFDDGAKGNLRVFPGHRRLEAVDSLGFALEVAAFTHNRIFITAPARLFVLDDIVLTGVVADIRTYHLLPVLNA